MNITKNTLIIRRAVNPSTTTKAGFFNNYNRSKLVPAGRRVLQITTKTPTNTTTIVAYTTPTGIGSLFQEESITQRRSWGKTLTYYTGIGYLDGAVIGGGKSLKEGVVKAFEPAGMESGMVAVRDLSSKITIPSPPLLAAISSTSAKFPP